MSKTRKFLTTVTMVAMTTTASLTAVSSAQANPGPPGHIHFSPSLPPGAFTPTPPGPLFPIPPGAFTPTPTPTPPAHPPHRHGGLRRGEAAALGVLGGVIIGSALANANRRATQPAPAANLPAAHYAWCDAKYKTYVIATNTYTGYDMKPHYCISPYVN